MFSVINLMDCLAFSAIAKMVGSVLVSLIILKMYARESEAIVTEKSAGSRGSV